jgi:hypothetical protein
MSSLFVDSLALKDAKKFNFKWNSKLCMVLVRSYRVQHTEKVSKKSLKETAVVSNFLYL